MRSHEEALSNASEELERVNVCEWVCVEMAGLSASPTVRLA